MGKVSSIYLCPVINSMRYAVRSVSNKLVRVFPLFDPAKYPCSDCLFHGVDPDPQCVKMYMKAYYA